MDYTNLADSSRVWIYQSNKVLSPTEVSEIETLGAKFIEQWAAHGAELKAAFKVFYNRFLVLFADESQVKASGCSIDSSVRFFKEIEQHYKIDLFDRLNIAYREDQVIKTMNMSDFQDALNTSEIPAETVVFNNLVQTLGEFKNTWEIPVMQSWHANLVH